ncbi:helix-turn-helix XRE-family transcriptional regulators [Candidatus Termititenax aidoneus]|uniref:Helix-turn-helix XRE-family transcriptional regulators n=1 Tax=Termititenax aidoneus TaxID=2218524 RepID=A0A388TAL9_TERA1|nr:helix-turn-helix XRE-family transcriptional regulators [Candidatus Termititenax aidoneus]
MGLKQIFIANLRKIRRAAGLSQMQLAFHCNTAPSYIGEIEIGRRFPSIEMIEKIAAALQVQPQLLFADQPRAPRRTTPRDFSFLPETLKKDLLKRVTAATQKVLQKY